MGLESGVYGSFSFMRTVTISKHFITSFGQVWNELSFLFYENGERALSPLWVLGLELAWTLSMTSLWLWRFLLAYQSLWLWHLPFHLIPQIHPFVSFILWFVTLLEEINWVFISCGSNFCPHQYCSIKCQIDLCDMILWRYSITCNFLFCNYVQVTADRDYVPGEQVKYYFFIEHYVYCMLLWLRL